MSQKRYTFFTFFFVFALLLLTSVAMRDYVSGNSPAETRVL